MLQSPFPSFQRTAHFGGAFGLEKQVSVVVSMAVDWEKRKFKKRDSDEEENHFDPENHRVGTCVPLGWGLEEEKKNPEFFIHIYTKCLCTRFRCTKGFADDMS